MNFGAVLKTVSNFLQDRGFRHAMIGGVALAAYGLARSTLDLDFVVESSAENELIHFMESAGYETLFRSQGYSNHLHPDPSRGRVDFVYVQGETSEKLFSACRQVQGPGGLQIPVPKPEHLAAMKVLAMKNDPSRKFQEMADLRFLLSLPKVDRIEIRDYFERHGMKEQFDEIG